MLVIIIILMMLQLTVLVSMCGWLAGIHRILKRDDTTQIIEVWKNAGHKVGLN